MNQKWDVVTDTFKNGSQQADTKAFYLLNFLLYPEVHATKVVIKHKFEDMVREFRSILLFEDLFYIVNQMKKMAHEGPKKNQAEVETDIITGSKHAKENSFSMISWLNSASLKEICRSK